MSPFAPRKVEGPLSGSRRRTTAGRPPRGIRPIGLIRRSGRPGVSRNIGRPWVQTILRSHLAPRRIGVSQRAFDPVPRLGCQSREVCKLRTCDVGRELGQGGPEAQKLAAKAAAGLAVEQM